MNAKDYLEQRCEELRAEIDYGGDDDIFLGKDAYGESVSKKQIHDALLLELETLKQLEDGKI